MSIVKSNDTTNSRSVSNFNTLRIVQYYLLLTIFAFSTCVVNAQNDVATELKMKERYSNFEGYLFHYKYPYKWSLRNKNYMKKTFNRRPELEYMTPPTNERLEDCEKEKR